jgi:hypothetical protein
MLKSGIHPDTPESSSSRPVTAICKGLKGDGIDGKEQPSSLKKTLNRCSLPPSSN